MLEKNHQCAEMKRTIEQSYRIKETELETIMQKETPTMRLIVISFPGEEYAFIPIRFCPFCGINLVNEVSLIEGEGE